MPCRASTTITLTSAIGVRAARFRVYCSSVAASTTVNAASPATPAPRLAMSALFPSRAPPHTSIRTVGIVGVTSELGQSELRKKSPDRGARERRWLVNPVELAPDDGIAGVAALIVDAARGAARDGRGRAVVARAERVAHRPAHRDVDRGVVGSVRSPV